MRPITVPGGWENQFPGEVGTFGRAWYRKRIQVPAEWSDRAVFLHFGAVNYHSQVWVNDTLVGEHEGGYTPFYFRIDPSLKPVSAFLRREDHVGIYRRNARPDGRVLFVSGIDAHVVLATPFRLKQADYAVVLELLAHRPHQNWAQRRLPTIEKRKETTKFNMEASREAAAARTRLQYGDAATMTEPTTGTILIVDDDEGVTTTFARMLRLEGYHVHTALNAEMGLREAQTSRPDAIILDLRMPLVDGLGFLRRLRAHEDQRDTPVAIVTGDYFLDDTVSNELRALGAELRFKPMWLEDLVGLARTLLKVTTDRRGDSIH